MKAHQKFKFANILIILVSISVIFSACSSIRDYDNQEKETESSMVSTTVSVENDIKISSFDEVGSEKTYYTQYYALKHQKYQNAIRNNKIDIQYSTEFNEFFTNQELMELESEYIVIWKNELDRSINDLVDRSQPQLKDEIISTHKAWEENLSRQMDIEREVLFQDIGLSTVVQWLSKYKEIYRYRTFEIKYLSYMIEYMDDPFREEFTSLDFQINTQKMTGDGSLS